MRSANKRNTDKDLKTIKWLYQCAGGQRLRLVFVIASNAIGAVISVLFALVCKEIVDGAAGSDWNRLVRCAVFLFILILGEILLNLAVSAVREFVMARLRIKMQDLILKTLMEKDFSAISGFHSGELQNRMFSDVNIVVGGMVNILPSIIYLIFRLVGAAAVLIVLSPGFTILFLIAGVLICVVMTLLRGKLKFMHKRVQETEGQVRSFFQETLESILVIKVFGAQKRIRAKADDVQNRYFNARMKRRFVGIMAGAGFGMIFEMGYFLAMVWGCVGIFNRTMTYGTLTAMLQLVNQIQSPFSGFSSLLSQYYTVLASAERIMELEELSEETTGDAGEAKDAMVQNAADPGTRASGDEPKTAAVSAAPHNLYADLQGISFDHVDFTYGRNPVLTDISLFIKKGSFVSLTGLSGGGKSTMFLLMLGAYHASKGTVKFTFHEGLPDMLPGRKTREMFAYVPQGNYLFSGTLRENVTFLDRDIPEEKIWEALKLACAEEFVRELPQGLETVLGERGHGLSEGQMQRLAVARALLSEAPILLFDEATSALDEVTEAQLLKNIQTLEEKTCLIVTHRKAALSICSQHLVLRDGVISDTSVLLDNNKESE